MMKKSPLVTVLSGCVLYAMVAVSGCYVQIEGLSMPAKYERKVQLSRAFVSGSTFEAETHNGEITVTGSSVTNCRLLATITTRAGTQQEAKELAKQVKVTLRPTGKKLAVKIEKPRIMVGKSVSINLKAMVPNQTSPALSTHNGPIRIANINGKTRATTHNGPVTIERVSGNINLTTHNGKISCTEIGGDIQLRTHNGSVNVVHSKTSADPVNISIVTHNGEIDFTSPPNLSAAVELATYNGLIRTDLPITVTGQISKRKLKGIIGSGEGKVHLETHNGSIKLR